MSVLLLNGTWQPLGQISTKRAFGLLQAGKAIPVEGVAKVLRAGSMKEYVVPSVICLTYYVNVPQPKARWSKLAVFKRDNWQCGYCGKPLTRDTATIDHIVPQSKGGRNTWTNTVTACMSCNQRKDSKPLSETGMRLLVNPRRPRVDLIKLSGNMPTEWHKFIEI